LKLTRKTNARPHQFAVIRPEAEDSQEELFSANLEKCSCIFDGRLFGDISCWNVRKGCPVRQPFLAVHRTADTFTLCITPIPAKLIC